MSELVTAWGPEGWKTYTVGLSNGVEWLGTSDRPSDKFLVPGFVDTHIHGAYGMDFMASDTDEIVAGLERLSQDGYEALLATTVTASLESTDKALDTLPIHEILAGVHLEGPFLSPDYPGAQPPQAILPAPTQDSAWWPVLEDPRVRLVTLAPERDGMEPVVRRLAKRGTSVSAGHTNAASAQIKAAVSWGLDRATHTFNAMSPLHHREPGTVGAVLTTDTLTAELIYDSQHVSRQAADVLLRCKPAAKVVAVSDCTMAKGLAPGTCLSMWGHSAIVGQQNVRLASNAALAGSASTLHDCFRCLAQDFSPETATRLCCVNPRSVLKGDLTPKKWLLFDNNLEMLTQFASVRPK